MSFFKHVLPAIGNLSNLPFVQLFSILLLVALILLPWRMFYITRFIMPYVLAMYTLVRETGRCIGLMKKCLHLQVSRKNIIKDLLTFTTCFPLEEKSCMP